MKTKLMANQATPLPYPPQKQGFNKALWRETNGYSNKPLIRPFMILVSSMSVNIPKKAWTMLVD